MSITNIICEDLNKKLPGWLLATPSCGGVAVVIRTPISERRLIIDLWWDIYGMWRWKSLFIGDELSGSGTIFEGKKAVERAARKASEEYQILGRS